MADRELLERDVEQYLRQHERKELLRMVVIGSVDDGKSTLIGRLLHDTGGIFEDQLSAVRRASARGATRAGGSAAEVDLSLVTDGLRAEREQGITIDVAYRYFTTSTRKFIIADTPGHVQYTRNMATGASTANVAVILVDARLGVLAQTRRHAYIAALLGIPHLVACVNKMDLVGWDRARFEAIRGELERVGRDLGIRDVRSLPVSALRGEHVVRRGDGPWAGDWYDGPTLLEHLEEVPIATDRNLDDLRFPVQYVIRPGLHYRGFAGQVQSGVLRVGDEIVALPSGRRSRVASIDTFDGSIDEAHAPTSVTVRLADEIDVGRGDMLVHPARPPAVAERVDAMLVWMSERPLDPARSYLIKHTSRYVRAEIESIEGVVDPETLAPRRAARLELNDIARVTVRAHQPLFVDPYATNRATGAFIVVDALTHDTVGAGMIRGVATTPVPARRVERRLEAATADEAFALARSLYDEGQLAAVVPADRAAAVVAAGLVAIVVSSS